jgi:5-methylcytosine-specific restriction endonuclease McrA
VNAPARVRPSDRRSLTAGNRGQGGKWLHPKTRLRIYDRDGWRCVWCTAQVERPTLPEDGLLVCSGDIRQASVDHVVPRSRGGSNDPSNLITACAQCNAKRGHRSVPAFAVALCGAASPVLVAYLRHLEPIKMIVRRVRAAQRRRLPT